jgi:hypothetical protein
LWLIFMLETKSEEVAVNIEMARQLGGSLFVQHQGDGKLPGASTSENLIGKEGQIDLPCSYFDVDGRELVLKIPLPIEALGYGSPQRVRDLLSRELDEVGRPQLDSHYLAVVGFQRENGGYRLFDCESEEEVDGYGLVMYRIPEKFYLTTILKKFISSGRPDWQEKLLDWVDLATEAAAEIYWPLSVNTAVRFGDPAIIRSWLTNNHFKELERLRGAGDSRIVSIEQAFLRILDCYPEVFGERARAGFVQIIHGDLCPANTFYVPVGKERVRAWRFLMGDAPRFTDEEGKPRGWDLRDKGYDWAYFLVNTAGIAAGIRGVDLAADLIQKYAERVFNHEGAEARTALCLYCLYSAWVRADTVLRGARMASEAGRMRESQLMIDEAGVLLDLGDRVAEQVGRLV